MPANRWQYMTIIGSPGLEKNHAFFLGPEYLKNKQAGDWGSCFTDVLQYVA